MKSYEILRPHEEATEHDVCDAVAGEVGEEEVDLVAPAGVHQEHRRHEVLVPRGVRGDVAADRAHRLPVLPAKIFDVYRKNICNFHNGGPDAHGGGPAQAEGAAQLRVVIYLKVVETRFGNLQERTKLIWKEPFKVRYY